MFLAQHGGVYVKISFYFRIRYLIYKVMLMVLVEDVGFFFRQEVQTAGCSLPCKVEMGRTPGKQLCSDISFIF